MLAVPVYILIACNKDMATTGNPPPVTPPVKSPISDKQVSSAIQGNVVDEQNKPLAGVQVKCGDVTATTDAAGSFFFGKVNANQMAAVVTAQKNGYFNGSRTFHIAAADKLQFVQIQLLPKKAAGTFVASTGGTVNTSNAQFTFAAQQVLGPDNKPYSGKVSLLYAPINPERADFADIMPGDLRGITNSNTIVGLQSFGMMALELQSEGGEKLHLDTSKQVSFKMTIPTSLQNTAPPTIPLWYFEEVSGVWRQEGSATKTGDSYSGIVKHFSFWNLDMPFPLVNFTATLVDAHNTPLSNAAVKLKRANGSATYGYTNENGTVSGDIPKNETLTLEVMSKCNMAVDTRNIGPFNDHTDIGILRVTVPNNEYLYFSGAVASCNNMPVQNGLVSISLGGTTYRSNIANGQYSISILRCVTTQVTAIINAVDQDANKMSTNTKLVTTGNYITNLSACDVILADFVNSLLNGQTANYTATDSISLYNLGSGYLLSAARKTNRDFIDFQVNDMTVGTHATSIALTNNGKYYSGNGTYTLTQSGTLGGYLAGTFTSSVKPDSTQNNGPFPFTGSFRIRITQ